MSSLVKFKLIVEVELIHLHTLYFIVTYFADLSLTIIFAIKILFSSKKVFSLNA